MNREDLATLTYELRGLRVAIDTDNPFLAEHYLERLEAFLKESDGAGETVTTQRHEAGRIEP